MNAAKIFYLIIVLVNLVPTQKAQSQKKHIDYFLNKAGVTRKQFSLPASRNGRLINTNLDDYRDVFSNFKLLQFQLYDQNKEFITNLHRQQGRLQPLMMENAKFPCDLNNSRSKEVPSSVNRLRPGDIDIIAAMGDSLTAGTAILGNSVLLQGFAEFRGVTFLGGGLKDWRTYLTLPNILKAYNPQLYGYAIGNTLARERPAKFNVAEPLATTQDMPYQAQVLIKRLQHDPKVNMTNHWKLISILIGSNDICNDVCHYDNWNDYLDNHRKDMYKTLKLLKTHVPRTIINLLPAINVQDVIRNMHNVPLSCYMTQRIECSCIVGDRWNSEHIKKFDRTIRRQQQIDEELAALPEFQTEDFSVVYRGFSAKLMQMKTKNGDADLRYFADDCFHLSQFGNAAAAQTLWNNMVQGAPPESKSLQEPFNKFECPSEERPYLATLKNS